MFEARTSPDVLRESGRAPGYRDDGATEVLLTHSGFPNEEIRDLHARGWGACISNLERGLS